MSKVKRILSVIMAMVMVLAMSVPTFAAGEKATIALKNFDTANKVEYMQIIQKDEIREELNKTAIPRNWDYYMNQNKYSENISPTFAYDDGQFTYLGFNSIKDIPSVFLYENDKESILNTHIKKDGNYDVLVIQKTAKHFVLRSGDRIVGILNKSFGINPKEVQQTTISKDIQRELIDGK